MQVTPFLVSVEHNFLTLTLPAKIILNLFMQNGEEMSSYSLLQQGV